MTALKSFEARRKAVERFTAVLAVSGTGRDPRKRLIATALGYMQFAHQEPSLFALLFTHTKSQRADIDSAPPAESPYGLLVSRVQDFLGVGGRDVEILSFGIWSLVHGAAILRHNHLEHVNAPFIAGVQKNLLALLDGWTKK